MMMAPPQVVGVLLKKPGEQNHSRLSPLDPQETKIRGELYVEDLNERRIVSVRMGWLWVEGTQMRLPLRALNLRQATPGICQPHVLALGFTLSNSQGDLLATFWADTEPIYWSWVRAIAAELVRQTPFRAQRCLNFLEILTICPRGPLPLPESPTETRRRSRSELRCCWLGGDSPMSGKSASRVSSILEDSRRRARSELRGWSSSNSSDEDLHLGEFRSGRMRTTLLPKVESALATRTWGCSESSEGSDDSLPWGAGCRSSVDSIDSAPLPPTPTPTTPPPTVIPEADTRELRIQRYKEARRRENEARSRRVLEEDAKRRKARRQEENNNNNNNNNNDDDDQENDDATHRCARLCDDARTNGNKPETTAEDRAKLEKNNRHNAKREDRQSKSIETATFNPFVRAAETVDAITRRLPPLRVSAESPIVRFTQVVDSHRREDANNNNNNNNSSNENRESSARCKIESPPSPGVVRTDSGERRSRARERRNVREKSNQISLVQQPPQQSRIPESTVKTSLPEERKERLSLVSRIPVLDSGRTSSNSRIFERTMDFRERGAISLPRTSNELGTNGSPPSSCEEDVARLLERCQRVDRYVPVREKLTLFESLSRMGGRLARSTEDLGRSSSRRPSPRGKQRARSLHDLNRAARSLPVREMCRLFEAPQTSTTGSSLPLLSTGQPPPTSILKSNAAASQDVPPCVRTSTRRKHYQK